MCCWGKPFWIEAKNGKAVFARVTVVTVTLFPRGYLKGILATDRKVG